MLFHVDLCGLGRSRCGRRLVSLSSAFAKGGKIDVSLVLCLTVVIELSKLGRGFKKYCGEREREREREREKVCARVSYDQSVDSHL